MVSVAAVAGLWLLVKHNRNILECVTSVVLPDVSNAVEKLEERDVWSTYVGECGVLVPLILVSVVLLFSKQYYFL